MVHVPRPLVDEMTLLGGDLAWVHGVAGSRRRVAGWMRGVAGWGRGVAGWVKRRGCRPRE